MKNREIKFRAWDGEQMVSPDYIDRKGFAWWKSNSIPTNSDKVMQYIGLKDKNGKEIYEGDIVKFKCHHGAIEIEDEWFPALASQLTEHEFEEIYVIEDIKTGLRKVLRNGMNLENRITNEVIGNIYENKELLK